MNLFRASRVGCCAALLVALCCPPARAAMPLMSKTQYVAALGSLLSAIDADAESGKRSAETIVAAIVRCDVADGAQRIFVDNRIVLAQLSAAEATTGSARRDGLRAVHQRITAIRSEIESASITPAQTAVGVNAVREIMKSSEYASDAIPPPSKMDRLAARLQKWWDDLMRKFRFKGPSVPTPTINPKIPLIIMIVIAIGAVSILVWYLFGLIRSRPPGGVKQRPESILAMNEEEEELVASRNFDRLLDLAKSHADKEDFRSAFRLVYVATLVGLDTDGIVRLNRSKTNWEYLRALRLGSYNRLYEALLPLTRDFDRIWYGFAVATADDYERSLQQYEKIRRSAISAPEAAVAQPSAARANH